ncbi:MAG: DNA recombination protein RmuC [Halioglobus sp.]|nr:DNA recombination protein RmuC [Halioglobus sp.]
MTTLTDEQLIIIAAALAATLVTALVISIWQGITSRRALAATREELHAREQELSEARAEARGQSVAVEQGHRQLQANQHELNTLKAELAAMHQQLNKTLQEHAQLKTQQLEREDRHLEQITLLNETRENLKKEFENLANRIFEDKGKSFTSTSQASLEALLKPFREQITGFQTRINEVHSESLRGNTALEKEIQRVLEVGLEMNSQASNLTMALKGDKKTAGNWGEAQLQRTLELAGLQAGEHYESQATFRDQEGKRKLPDFIIKLPDSKNIVIDSKVSLVDYDRAIAADTDEACTEALNAHAQAVRNHIDDLASKNYANLLGIGSPDFVLMFMPIEPAYIEAMKHNKELFNYGYKKGVIMVSHTTLMPILRTVANLWMIEQGNREAKEISSRAGDIYNQVCLVAERLNKLGNTLRAANNHYNETITGLVGKQGLHGKVERFQQLSAKANKEMASLEAIHDDIENDRLETIAGAQDEGAELPRLEEADTLENEGGPIVAKNSI